MLRELHVASLPHDISRFKVARLEYDLIASNGLCKDQSLLHPARLCWHCVMYMLKFRILVATKLSTLSRITRSCCG
jgi:hypothetical protein